MKLHLDLLASSPEPGSEISGGVYADIYSAKSKQDLQNTAKTLEKDLTSGDPSSATTISPQFLQNSTSLIAQGGSINLINPSYESYLYVPIVGAAPARRMYTERNGQQVSTPVRNIERFIKLIRDQENVDLIKRYKNSFNTKESITRFRKVWLFWS